MIEKLEPQAISKSINLSKTEHVRGILNDIRTSLGFFGMGANDKETKELISYLEWLIIYLEGLICGKNKCFNDNMDKRNDFKWFTSYDE